MTQNSMPLRGGRDRDQRRADRAVLLPLRRLFRPCTGAPYAPEIRLSGRRREGRPRRSDDMEAEAQSPLHLPRMRHAPLHRCQSGGACAASTDTCFRRANFRPAFHVPAPVSRSDRSSTTSPIIRGCRRVSAARTIRLGGSASAPSSPSAVMPAKVGQSSKCSTVWYSRVSREMTPSGIRKRGARTYTRSARPDLGQARG